MIFGYTIEEAKKTAVTIATMVVGLVAMFVFVEPGLAESIPVLIAAGVNVVGVFWVRHSNPEDVSKALAALVTSGAAVLGFFIAVDPSQTAMVIAVVVQVVDVAAVLLARNRVGRTHRLT